MELEHFWGDFKVFNSQKEQKIPHLEIETHKRKHRNPFILSAPSSSARLFLGVQPFFH